MPVITLTCSMCALTSRRGNRHARVPVLASHFRTLSLIISLSLCALLHTVTDNLSLSLSLSLSHTHTHTHTLPHTVADNLSLSLSALVYTVADNLSLSLSLSPHLKHAAMLQSVIISPSPSQCVLIKSLCLKLWTKSNHNPAMDSIPYGKHRESHMRVVLFGDSLLRHRTM